MFERVHDGPRALAHHQEAPFVGEREAYLKHLAAEGRRPKTIEGIATKLIAIANRIDIGKAGPIDVQQIELAADDWAAGHRWYKRPQGPERTRRRFIRVAKGWFRFLGRLEPPEDSTAPFANLLNDFASFLGTERGLSSITISTWSGCVRRFLAWYRDQNRQFSQIGLPDIEEYFALQGGRWSRKTVAGYVAALRAFFRHAFQRGWIPSGIAESILKPRIFQHEALPAAPAWETVQRLIASTKTGRPADIRDHAILLLFSVYGFRSGEVGQLCLTDLDWETETITLTRTKPRKSQQYPLTYQVGEAILRYLREVRPQSTHKEVFLTMVPPFRPLSRSAFWDMTRERLKRLGITSGCRGPHLLRHACASHLLSEGFSLKEIGDHLGHCDPQSTRIYAKTDLSGLREVARFDLGELL